MINLPAFVLNKLLSHSSGIVNRRALAVVIFFWAVKSNQFEDLDRQGYSILFDDDLSPEEKKLAEQRKRIQQENEKNGSD